MTKFRPAGLPPLIILIGIIAIAVPATRAGVLETTIDLNYTYEQTHLGDDITGETSVEQQYSIEYDTALNSLFDMVARITLDLQNTSEDQEPDTSRVAPSLDIFFSAPKTTIRLNYDATVDKTEQFRDDSGDETYSSTYVLEMEVVPDYWPETKVKFERKRNFEDQDTENVEKIFSLDLRKEIGDLSLEFDFEGKKKDEVLPAARQKKDTSWAGKVAYQSVLWWDVDVDLTYEIEELYTEEFTQGVISAEDEEYIHNIQARLQKSLILTPRLKADLAYQYEFEQDLLFLEMDYRLSNDLGLGLTYEMFNWLEMTADFERTILKTVNVRPQDDDEEVEDLISLGFTFEPVRWFSVIGQAEWNLEQKIETLSGATLDEKDEATYEISARHRWGSWWALTVTGSSEYEYVDDWLTKEKAQFVAAVDIEPFQDVILELSYDREHGTIWEERSPLALGQAITEEFEVKFEFDREFSDMIRVSFVHEFGVNWETEIDEVMNEEELVELYEDTKIKLVLAVFVRDMNLEGEITRKATDTKDDEEPILIDISYALKLEWLVDHDWNVVASYQYDDNGDTFDESSLHSEITWSRDTFEVSGEYQFDKTYSDEIDEQRKLNLNMNMLF